MILRLPLLLALILPATLAADANEPGIDANVGTDGGTGDTNGEGVVSISGKIRLPAGWTLSIHTVTIRHEKHGGTTTLNAFLPVKGLEFNNKVNLKAGSYKVWAVIDVKDSQGREREISSQPSNVNIQ